MIQSGNYEKYADIIHLLHYQSAKRPHMPEADRAAQFSPFAALTGYEDAVKETARLTDERIELDECSKEALDFELNKIRERLQHSDAGQNALQPVSITYFVPDEYKSGGAYVTAVGVVKKIDVFEQVVVMTDGIMIPIIEIIEIAETEENSL